LAVSGPTRPSDLVQTLDARLDWTTRLPIGGLHLYGAATYHFDQTERGLFQPTIQTVGYLDSPLVLRANVGADWSWGALTIGGNVQYFSRYHVYPADDDAYSDGLVAAVQGSDIVPAQAYLDLRVSERFPLSGSGFAKDLKIEFGIENVFDADPPRVTASGVNAPSYSQFGDPLRRRFELVLSSRF
jgi:iron complex outermembrane receptor protein